MLAGDPSARRVKPCVFAWLPDLDAAGKTTRRVFGDLSLTVPVHMLQSWQQLLLDLHAPVASVCCDAGGPDPSGHGLHAGSADPSVFYFLKDVHIELAQAVAHRPLRAGLPLRRHSALPLHLQSTLPRVVCVSSLCINPSPLLGVMSCNRLLRVQRPLLHGSTI